MHKIFGIRENVAYQTRKGAYLIAVKGDTFGVVQTPNGYFLLGGGMEYGETDESCIIRECMEEAGYAVCIKKRLCSAEAYEMHPKLGYFHPIQTYYLGELTEKRQAPTEKDHTLVWLPYVELKGKMHLEMQNWALEQIGGLLKR